MVQRRVIELVDDLKGGPADETVRFAIDGRDYEIDLSAKAARNLRAALAPYLSVARRVDVTRRPRTRGPAHVSGAGEANDSPRIREWARACGLEVSNRGRIPAYLRQAYERR